MTERERDMNEDVWHVTQQQGTTQIMLFLVMSFYLFLFSRQYDTNTRAICTRRQRQRGGVLPLSLITSVCVSVCVCLCVCLCVFMYVCVFGVHAMVRAHTSPHNFPYKIPLLHSQNCFSFPFLRFQPNSIVNELRNRFVNLIVDTCL